MVTGLIMASMLIIQPTPKIIEDIKIPTIHSIVGIQEEFEKEKIADVVENEVVIPTFNKWDITEISNLSVSQIEEILPNNMKKLAQAYYDAEQKYNVNALALVGITRLESGNMTSRLSETNNNLGGVKNGNKGYIYFESKYDCIDYIASILESNYLDEEGIYYNGKSLESVNKLYCEQDDWNIKVSEIANHSLSKL